MKDQCGEVLYNEVADRGFNVNPTTLSFFLDQILYLTDHGLTDCYAYGGEFQAIDWLFIFSLNAYMRPSLMSTLLSFV